MSWNEIEVVDVFAIDDLDLQRRLLVELGRHDLSHIRLFGFSVLVPPPAAPPPTA